MKAAAYLVLIFVYPILWMAKALNFLCSRDPLRLREPKTRTCWIERGSEVSRISYFSEASEQEGKLHQGFGRLATRVLCAAARPFAPPRTAVKEHTLMEKDLGIPDEVYTLW